MDLSDNASNEAIVTNEANEAKDEAHGMLDNQLAELEKLDVANENIEKVSRINEANATNEAVASDVAIETDAIEEAVKADDD
jgi:demethoxyubiquinone hydroxylase (CLK1/Coq7/Cat5 family)